METYKFSTDGKTISEMPFASIASLFGHLLNSVAGRRKGFHFVTDCFTTVDIKAGHTKQLIIRGGGKSRYLYVGKNLSIPELTAKYDQWGSLIVDKH